MTLFKDVFVVSGCGVGGGSLGYANTLYRPATGSAFYRDPQWARARGLGGRARAPLRHRRAHARRHDATRARAPPTRCCARSPTRWASPETYSTTRVGVFFGEPGETVRRPLLRRRGAAARGLHPLRRLHGRLPPQREEHAGQELPLVRRARRRADPARAHRRRDPPARRARRRDGYAVTSERSGAWFRKDRQALTAARRRRRRRPARHQPAAPALPPRRLAAAALRAHRLPRAHQQRGDLRRHHQGRPPRLHQVDRDHLELLSRPRHPHRERHLRPRRRLDLVPVHDPHRRRRRHAPAKLCAARAIRSVRRTLWPQVVAPHGDHPHDADARQLDAAASPSATCSASARGCRPRRTRTSPTRASSRSPTRSPAAPPRSSTRPRRPASPRRC